MNNDDKMSLRELLAEASTSFEPGTADDTFFKRIMERYGIDSSEPGDEAPTV